VHVCRPAVDVRGYGESYPVTDGPVTDGLACGPDFIVTTRENKQTTFEEFIKTYTDENTGITTT
jgi:hypothetical protein